MLVIVPCSGVHHIMTSLYFFITFVSSAMLNRIMCRLVHLSVHHSSIHRLLRLEIFILFFILLIVFVILNVSLFRADNNIISRATVLWSDVKLDVVL